MNAKLNELLERVKAATGPDREIDGDLAEAFDDAPSHLPRVTDVGRSWLWAEFVEPDSWETWEAPEYTASIDAALALVERVVPGWCWRIGTCHVSDDAWVAPDWNDPAHSARLRAELGEPVFGTLFDQGADVDRRPPGNLPLAILEALLMALIAKESAHPAPALTEPRE
jgi:hypothetical protein